MAEPAAPQPKLGLVLPGGGARAAYQAGVLAGIAELLPADAPIPFPVISGTSAGAINAALIATRARRFRQGAGELAAVWEHIQSELVYRTDTPTVFKNLLYWVTALLHSDFGRRHTNSLLDNTPLRRLLERHIVFERLQEGIDAGVLDALSVTCSGYTSARAICFYQGKPGLKPWHRMRRLGRPVELRLDHIMASVALPLFFAPVRLGHEYCGDGSLRQMAPLSPVIHLGAERILVIAVRNERANKLPGEGTEVLSPTLGQVAGALLDVVFMDSLYADLERMQRINLVMREIAGAATELRPLKVIDTMIVTPSADIRDIAERHVREFPRSVRLLLRGLGGTHSSGTQLFSYLLFESGFCSELVALGRRDAHAQADKLLAFMGTAPRETDKVPTSA